MAPITSSAAIEQTLAELAWSLWTELGVSGVFRHHSDWNVDLEPLIILTAALADVDPRLRDESTDWCIRYARLVAAARLKTLLSLGDSETRSAFGEYSATVRAHVRVNWPGEDRPRPYEPTGRSRLDSLGRAALFGLRQRALFGTGARAEIIRVLASNPDRAFSAAELADDAAFTKRAVEHEIESLRLAGLVTWTALHGRRQFKVARRDELLAFVGSRPSWTPRWAPLIRVLLGGYRLLARVDSMPPVVRDVEARKYLRAMRANIEQADLTTPPASNVGILLWDEVVDWLQRVTLALARGNPDIFGESRLTSVSSSARA